MAEAPSADVRPPRASPLVLLLLLAGFAAAAVALVEGRSARMAAPGWSWRADQVDEIVKSPLYYAAHAAQIGLVLAAGLLSLLLRHRALRRRALVWFVLLQAAGLTMALRGMQPSDFLTTRLADATGPLATAISVVAFAAVGPGEWRLLGRLAYASAFAVSGASAWAMSTLASTAREDTVASLQPLLSLLYWLAAWVLLTPARRGALAAAARWVPLLVYVAGSVVVQTRLNLAMAALLVLARLYASARAEHRSAAAVGGLLVTALAAAALGPLLAGGTPLEDLFRETGRELGGRLSEDTRSHQLVSFFADLSPLELLLGRGSRATWNWPGMSSRWGGGTDVGYLSLLLFGGAPLLVTYVAFHLAPAWRVLRSRGQDTDIVSSLVVLLWAARMFLSSFPSLSLDYYVVLLCVGACLREDRRLAVEAPGGSPPQASHGRPRGGD